MTKHEFIYKTRAYLHRKIVINQRTKKNYYLLYKSYWHLKFSINSKQEEVAQFLTSRPNPGAGIGHQIANWLSGLKIADMFSLIYATYPFSYLSRPFVPNEWNSFLGLNDSEIKVEDLLNQGYRKILLPLFNVDNAHEVEAIQKIINSYYGEKVIFLLELDEFAGNELKYLDFMREKYRKASKANLILQYNKENYNIAIHIRRGDIVQDKKKKDNNLTMRWLDNEYYLATLSKYLNQINPQKEVHIYLFSQSNICDLQGYERYGIVHYCNKMSAMESFYHMVNADLFIMSRSGMSYQAAKLNENGIIIYPNGFWREPVNSEKWIIED